MSAVGLDQPHIAEHLRSDGLCQCPCSECTTRTGQFCICDDCPCESDAEHRVRRP